MRARYEFKKVTHDTVYTLTLTAVPNWAATGITVEQFDAMQEDEIRIAEKEEGFLDALAEALLDKFIRKGKKRRF